MWATEYNRFFNQKREIYCRVPEQKKGDNFVMPTSPKNGGLHVCFMRLSFNRATVDFYHGPSWHKCNKPT